MFQYVTSHVPEGHFTPPSQTHQKIYRTLDFLEA